MGRLIVRSAAFLAFCIFVQALSCIHDLSLPLHNAMPVLPAAKNAVCDTLFYPDSILDTVSIDDINDSVLSFACVNYHIACDSDFCSSALCDSLCDTICDSAPWPGTIRPLVQNLDEKAYELIFSTPNMGVYSGKLIISDQQGGQAFLPFTIARMFVESFSDSVINPNRWSLHLDSSEFALAYIYSNWLRFEFSQNPDSLNQTSPLVANANSKFRICGDFHVCVDFELRDDMFDNFEISFFISDSSSPNKWVGEKAGITFDAGALSGVRIKGGYGLNQMSQEIDFYSGTFEIFRTAGALAFVCRDINNIEKIAFSGQNFAYPADSVFVHMRMQVPDLKKTRHCAWNDFKIIKGEIVTGN